MATPRLMASLAAVPWLLQGAVAEDELGLAHVREQCHSLLGGMGVQGRSRFELGALCRQRLPHDICRDALGALGNQPWSQEAKDATCDRWAAEWRARAMRLAPGRRAKTMLDLQKSLDYCTAKKAELGLCVNKTMDECAQNKAEEYPKLAQRISDVLQSMYRDYQHSMGMGPPATLPAAHAGSGAHAAAGAAAKYDASRRLDLGTSGALRAASAALAMALLAGVAAFVWRARRSVQPYRQGLVSEERGLEE